MSNACLTRLPRSDLRSKALGQVQSPAPASAGLVGCAQRCAGDDEIGLLRYGWNAKSIFLGVPSISVLSMDPSF